MVESASVPWTIRVDPSKRVSYVSLSGGVTFDDLAAAQRELAAHRQFDPAFPLLLDLRNADDVRLTPHDLQSLGAVSALGLATRRAILVGSLGVFAMARMYETLREGQTKHNVVRACRTLDECSDWLGVELSDPHD
jgi:hypothetical protein